MRQGDGAEGRHEREFSDKAKQLSPVSVLELHSDEGRPTRSRSKLTYPSVRGESIRF